MSRKCFIYGPGVEMKSTFYTPKLQVSPFKLNNSVLVHVRVIASTTYLGILRPCSLTFKATDILYLKKTTETGEMAQ